MFEGVEFLLIRTWCCASLQPASLCSKSRMACCMCRTCRTQAAMREAFNQMRRAAPLALETVCMHHVKPEECLTWWRCL